LELLETLLFSVVPIIPNPFETQPMTSGIRHARFVFGGLAVVVTLTVAGLTWWHSTQHVKSRASLREVQSTVYNENPGVSQTRGEMIRRPLPVALSRNSHEWTSLDAKDPEVIARISHNPEETKRLTEENARIKRRQLVYRKNTVPGLLQRLGEHSLKEFTVPGLDGREFEVEVVETRLNGLQAGSVLGRVKGVMNSMVSVGFSNGCESFNVCLPDENYYLTADAREPGEVLVKEIDPNVYTPPTKCEPIIIE
jgi:hypothetical protein